MGNLTLNRFNLNYLDVAQTPKRYSARIHSFGWPGPFHGSQRAWIYRYFQLTASLNFRTCNCALWYFPQKYFSCFKVEASDFLPLRSASQCPHKITILFKSVNALIVIATKMCRSGNAESSFLGVGCRFKATEANRFDRIDSWKNTVWEKNEK